MYDMIWHVWYDMIWWYDFNQVKLVIDRRNHINTHMNKLIPNNSRSRGLSYKLINRLFIIFLEVKLEEIDSGDIKFNSNN